MPDAHDDTYGLSRQDPTAAINAPDLPYRPRDPEHYRPPIGLVGCGGISVQHLTAYRNAGYPVVALCDLVPERAENRRAEFFPDARVYTSAEELLARADVEVVDIATHPPERVALIEAALRARKHVLSQKPFVLDLDTGERLADLADAQGVRLAVNQNGRWAPHFSYLRHAIAAGLVGDLVGAHLGVHWDHTWTIGTPFEDIHDLVLYDFAIHWFDIVTQFFGDRTPQQVFATRTRAAGQRGRPPLLAQALIDFDGGHASLVFDATVSHGQLDHTFVAGTRGTLTSRGPSLAEQTVTLYTPDGHATPRLSGAWFPDGFHGSMGELLCVVEEGREARNGARDNLRGLGLCFAAIASATEGTPQVPGRVRRLPAPP